MKMIPRWDTGPSILMYHSISEGSEDPYNVPPDRFQEQVSWLVDHGFELVPLALIVNLLKSGDYQNLKRKVALTFDDGYRDFLTGAFPILLRHKTTATVFIVTGMLGEKATWSGNSKDVQLMSEDEIRDIRAQGINLGSHTMTHENITTINPQELYRQLTESRAKLIELGETFYSFSYPWGQRSSQTLEAVKTSGFDCAVTAGKEILPYRIDLYQLPRVTMSADMNLKSFQKIFERTFITHARMIGSALKRCFA